MGNLRKKVYSRPEGEPQCPCRKEYKVERYEQIGPFLSFSTGDQIAKAQGGLVDNQTPAILPNTSKNIMLRNKMGDQSCKTREMNKRRG